MAVADWNLLAEIIVVIIVLIWKYFWYGFALYRAIERKQLIWFIVLIISVFILPIDFPYDLGLIPIVYIVYNYFIKSRNKPKQANKKKKR